MSTHSITAKRPFPVALRLVLLTAVTAVFAGGSFADEKSSATDPTQDESDAGDEPIEFDGVFVAENMTELSTGADQLGDLTIQKIKPHAARVSRGENVVWFEKEDPDDKVDAAKIELELAKVDLAEAEFQFEQFQEQQRLDRQAAERKKQTAQQAYDNFMRVDRERKIESAQFDQKQAEQSLANAREELEQLRQMYQEDDLTEESEEIVLERARHAVEAAEFRLAGVKIQSDRTIEQAVPRETKQQEEQLQRAELSHEEAIAKLRRQRQRRQLELKKERDKVADLEEELKELRKQRGALVLTAPHDGIVIHGALTRGRLSEKPPQMKAETSIKPDQVVVTIVDPSRLKVRVDVPESERTRIKQDMPVTVTPSADKQRSISGTVAQISSIPYAGTKFDATVTIDLEPDGLIRPTMTCKVKIDSDTNGQDDNSGDENETDDENETANENESAGDEKQDEGSKKPQKDAEQQK